MRVGSSVPRMFAQTARPSVVAYRLAPGWPGAARGVHVPRAVAGTVSVQVPNLRALLDRLSALANELLAPAPALAPAGALPEPPTEDASPSLWDGLLWAAPKKKVSHSRKAMRHANKGLKDRIGTYAAHLTWMDS